MKRFKDFTKIYYAGKIKLMNSFPILRYSREFVPFFVKDEQKL